MNEIPETIAPETPPTTTIKIWHVSYSTKDGPFFTEKAANEYNGHIHGGWGTVTESTAQAQLADPAATLTALLVNAGNKLTQLTQEPTTGTTEPPKEFIKPPQKH